MVVVVVFVLVLFFSVCYACCRSGREQLPAAESSVTARTAARRVTTERSSYSTTFGTSLLQRIWCINALY